MNAIRMVRLGGDLKYYIQSEQKMAPAERVAFLEKMSDRCQKVLTEYETLWLARNKSGGLGTSMNNLVKLNTQIEKEIKIQERGSIGRKVHRIIEKAIAAGVVLLVS